jgi:hypothetical protein
MVFFIGFLAYRISNGGIVGFRFLAFLNDEIRRQDAGVGEGSDPNKPFK